MPYKNKEVPSTKEESPVETPKQKSLVWSDRIDEVWINVHGFENRRKDGAAFTRYAVKPSRSYRDKYGQWQTTLFYGEDDLGKLMELTQRARDKIKSLRESEEQDAPEQEAQS